MNIESTYFYLAVVVGLGATLFMDLWALLLRRIFSIPSPNYCLVGRWIVYMPSGVFKHTNIAATKKGAAECVTGWIVHYVIGVIYAIALTIPTSGRWLDHPTLAPALLFGVSTVLIPYFIMQPAFGLGIASAKTAKPGQARVRSLMSHTAFGVGLYLSALLVSRVVHVYA